MIETVKENLVFGNKFIRFYNDDVLFPNGKTGTYARLESTASKGVVVIPVMENGEVVLIENFRYGPKEYVLEFPQGGVSSDESVEDAARRELFEETRLVCDKVTHLDTLVPAPHVFSTKSEVLVAWGCRVSEEPFKPDALEDIKSIRSYRIDDAIDLLLDTKTVSDTVSITALFKLSNLFRDDDIIEVSSRGAAYMFGFACRLFGLSISSNPYRNQKGYHTQYSKWNDGWIGANVSIQAG